MEIGEAFHFGQFQLFVDQRVLVQGGVPVSLGNRAFDILVMLLRHAGEIVSSAELRAAVWGNLALEQSNLPVQISAIRKVLGPDGKTDLLTDARRGYRFVGHVRQMVHGKKEPLRANSVRIALAPTPIAATGNLPIVTTPFFGRETDLSLVVNGLVQERLMSIVGSGGVGKTRFALQSGALLQDSFRDGVWFVELASIATSELMCETISALFGLSQSGGAATKSIDRLANFLKAKQLILIIDNCEHMIDQVRPLISALLGICPGVRVLVTSRERLGLDSEFVHRLPPLGSPAAGIAVTADQALRFDAVALFVSRATAQSAFVLTDSMAGVVAEICRRLDGVALAIELAAARMSILTPTEVLAQLNNRFRLLSRGGASSFSRYQTLAAAIDWSYQLLQPAEQDALRTLSVFGGSFTVAAAAEVLDCDQILTIELVASLIEKSLLSRVVSIVGFSRFVLMETTRAYASALLLESGDGGAKRRLAAYMVRLLRDADHSWATTGTAVWLATYGPEFDNKLSSLNWAFGPDGDAALGVEIVAYSAQLWHELGLRRERTLWRDKAEQKLGELTPPNIVARISLIPHGMRHFFDSSRVETFEHAARLLREDDEPLVLASVLTQLGLVLMRPGDPSKTEPVFQEASALLRPLGITKQLITLLDAMAAVRINTPDLVGASALIEQALALSQALDYQIRRFTLLNKRILIAFASGDVEQAIRFSADAVDACRETRHSAALVVALINRAGYLVVAGHTSEAWNVACEALQLSLAVGFSHGIAISAGHMALVLALSGDPKNAARLAGYDNGFHRQHQIDRELFEQDEWTLLLAKLECLDPGERQQLMDEGAAWNEEQVCAIAPSLHSF